MWRYQKNLSAGACFDRPAHSLALIIATSELPPKITNFCTISIASIVYVYWLILVFGYGSPTLTYVSDSHLALSLHRSFHGLREPRLCSNFEVQKSVKNSLNLSLEKKIKMALTRSLCFLNHLKCKSGNDHTVVFSHLKFIWLRLTVVTSIEIFGFQWLKFKLFLNLEICA